MPGIFGACTSENRNHLSGLMERMISSMNHGDKCMVDRFIDKEPGVCMGRVSLGIFNPVDQPVTDPGGDYHLVFHGELYDNHESPDPEFVLRQYLEKGDRCATGLNGVFHFVVYDKRLKRIMLFSDPFGLQPLYYSVLKNGIVFGAEVKALIEDDDVGKEPDYRSFADFFHYGQILGNKTLFKNIKLLPPGSLMSFDLNDGKTDVRAYMNLTQLFVQKGAYSSAESSEEAVSLLVESIQNRAANMDALGLSLSGGLDSRGILAGLQHNAEGIKTYTLGLSGCADQKLAEKMSAISRTRHEFIELDQSYIADFENMAQGMIHMSDGMYHPHESTEMLALEYFKKADFKILLRGHGGEIAKAALAYPVMVLPEVHACTTPEDVLSFIFGITNLVGKDVDHNRMFTPFFNEIMAESPTLSLKESCGEACEILTPADVCIYYYIREHIRRQVIASLDIFRTQIECRTPYIDEAFIKKLLTLPVEERNRGEIHFKLIKRCKPELLKIVNSNTGAPLDAGPLRLFIADKMNSLLNRLGVKGFRHYTEFQKWHRTGFRESSRKIIFSERLAARKMMNMDHLATVFEDHISGKRNYGHLLGTIVGLELWFRNFVD